MADPATPTAPAPAPLHVSLLALPEAAVSTLAGLYDVMNGASLSAFPHHETGAPPFQVEIVGEQLGPLTLASGVPLPVQRRVDDVIFSVEALDAYIAANSSATEEVSA